MEAGTFKTQEQAPGGELTDTTKQTLGAYRTKREALQSLKNEIAAGKSFILALLVAIGCSTVPLEEL